MNIRRYGFALITLISCAQVLQADEYPAAAQKNAPAESVQNLVDSIRDFQSSHQANDPIALQTFVTRKIMPSFALTHMSNWIAGPFARYMTDEDKAVLSQQLQTDLSRLLISQFHRLDFDSSRIRIHNARFTDDGKASVVVQVYLNQQRPINLSFRMQALDQRWKIVDVRSFGTSLSLYYRARYIDQLRRFRQQYAKND